MVLKQVVRNLVARVQEVTPAVMPAILEVQEEAVEPPQAAQ